jgi:hypothetical protein
MASASSVLGLRPRSWLRPDPAAWSAADLAAQRRGRSCGPTPRRSSSEVRGRSCGPTPRPILRPNAAADPAAWSAADLAARRRGRSCGPTPRPILRLFGDTETKRRVPHVRKPTGSPRWLARPRQAPYGPRSNSGSAREPGSALIPRPKRGNPPAIALDGQIPFGAAEIVRGGNVAVPPRARPRERSRVPRALARRHRASRVPSCALACRPRASAPAAHHRRAPRARGSPAPCAPRPRLTTAVHPSRPSRAAARLSLAPLEPLLSLAPSRAAERPSLAPLRGPASPSGRRRRCSRGSGSQAAARRR